MKALGVLFKPFFNADACKHACARVQTALPDGGEHDRRNPELGALREVFCVRKVFVKEFKELERFF